MSFSYGRREIGRREIGVLVGFVLVCELVGITGASATNDHARPDSRSVPFSFN